MVPATEPAGTALALEQEDFDAALIRPETTRGHHQRGEGLHSASPSSGGWSRTRRS